MNKNYKMNIWALIFKIIGFGIIYICTVGALIIIITTAQTDLEIFEISGYIIAIVLILLGIITALPYLFMSNMIELVNKIENNTKITAIVTEQIMKIKEYENDINNNEVETKKEE